MSQHLWSVCARLVNGFGIALFSVLTVGCASTNITAVKDPAFADRIYLKPAIYANTEDLQWRRSLEDTFVSELKKHGIESLTTIELAPPTREYRPDELAKILADNGVDALLLVEISQTGVENRYIPQTSSTTTTHGTVSTSGNSGAYQGQSHTTTTGGYEVSLPWAQMQTSLIDTATGQKAWIASSYTGGDEFTNFDNIRTSYCKEVLRQLIADGLLQENGAAKQ